MGRGWGGYVNCARDKGNCYHDSGGHKVTDPSAIFVGERYMDQGYETVFRQQKHNNRTLDLTIKTSDDKNYVKNIEVKKVESSNPSQIATNIKKAMGQIKDGDTVAIYLPNHTNTPASQKFAREGINEAKRKGYIKGPIEVWFSDKTKMDF